MDELVWFNVDDQLADHPKALTAGNAALGLWVRCGSWSSRQLSDGFLPENLAKSFGKPSEIKALLNAGLWHKVEGGYTFHEWPQYQRSAAEIKAKREAERVRKAAQRGAGVPVGQPVGLPPGSDWSNTNTHTKEVKDTSKRAVDSAEFNRFWEVYPKREQKGQARTAFAKALKLVDVETIIEGAERYRDSPKRNPNYTRNASTWLNGEGWADEVTPSSKPVPAGERLWEE
ncbi:hypothetical protein [Rhodococcus sp. BH5]|uniref:hypothetical protein n=1 Tax=Rhodococcus sp. BH5 TaxID=2871702 RepID=UPI0022CDA04F|nr:hypothetical protein [Rhodococcus sp. BH5]